MATSTIPRGSKINSAYTSWGQSLVAERYHIGILIINSHMPMTVWMPSTDTVSIRWIDNNGNIHYKSSTSNQLSFSIGNESGSDYTLTRNDATLTVTATADASMLLMWDNY